MNNQTIGTRFFHRFGLRSKVVIDFFNIKEERDGGNRQEYPLHERDVAEAVKHNIKTGAVTYEHYFRDYDLFTLFASTQSLKRDSYYGANHSFADYGYFNLDWDFAKDIYFSVTGTYSGKSLGTPAEI
ncbi:MAG TPA: hypothetical protein PLZ75_06645 [Bacteroidales bacterium]|jgi:outer membrane receptor for ferrienterochelin and colicins|nr:hypothetical protein [Bacteroidales bacterium]HQH24798.1 hypothetical protein [Bacteroidales bacterium]